MHTGTPVPTPCPALYFGTPFWDVSSGNVVGAIIATSVFSGPTAAPSTTIKSAYVPSLSPTSGPENEKARLRSRAVQFDVS